MTYIGELTYESWMKSIARAKDIRDIMRLELNDNPENRRMRTAFQELSKMINLTLESIEIVEHPERLHRLTCTNGEFTLADERARALYFETELLAKKYKLPTKA